MQSLTLFSFFVFFIYGVCIGSFLNVVVYRLPRKLPIAKGRSMCPKCEHTLGPADLVPLFSFLFLRGKCRYCGAPISWRYPAVEALTGAVFGLAGAVYGISIYAGILCVFFSVLILAWFIDLDEGYIPDRLHFIVLGAAAASLFWGPQVAPVDRLAGLILAGAMVLLSLLTGGGIGGGDIKLMACAGLLLGGGLTVPAFFLAYVLAAVRWLPAFVRKKLPPRFEVRMAPYFALSLMFWALFGRQVLKLWLNL